MSLYVSVVEPHEWALTDVEGKVIDSGTAVSLRDVARPQDRESVVGVVPGERVLTRSVQVPSRRRQRVLAAQIRHNLLGGVLAGPLQPEALGHAPELGHEFYFGGSEIEIRG